MKNVKFHLKMELYNHKCSQSREKRHRLPKKFTFSCTGSSQMILGLKYIYKSRRQHYITKREEKNEILNVAEIFFKK